MLNYCVPEPEIFQINGQSLSCSSIICHGQLGRPGPSICFQSSDCATPYWLIAVKTKVSGTASCGPRGVTCLWNCCGGTIHSNMSPFLRPALFKSKKREYPLPYTRSRECPVCPML